MRWALAAAAAAAAFALAPTALADDLLTLHPAGGGADTYASWVAQQGELDSVGMANQALLLHHGGPAPAAVLVRGASNQPVSFLAGLQWERRNDSICTTNDPRWTIAITGKSGKQYLVRLGCAVSAHSPGSTPGWTRDTNNQTVIRARILRVGGKDALTGTIDYLAIVVDKARGDAWLDNIQVTGRTASRTWTCAADNGYLPPDPASPVFAAADEVPWTADESMPADDLVASLTADEQYVITDEAIASS